MGSGASTVKHVSPTHTIDARGWVEAVDTPLPVGAGTLVYRDVEVEEREEGGSPCPNATPTVPVRREAGEDEGRARRERARQGNTYFSTRPDRLGAFHGWSCPFRFIFWSLICSLLPSSVFAACSTSFRFRHIPPPQLFVAPITVASPLH
ncbi:hypothetical protein FA13DRAFT_60074 [Coprinellus micaceus]|uniref:Uncharacterized protein n=1 Tax=Coprinellus micaceus TaxID=71717 RepID=A0A4Y7U1S7_COPMI|nr:hypothetical protein FA13DRAFT_60074 [Coprinellus micaceus]